MGTRILNYFNVFADLLFSLVDLETWAVQRFRKLLAAPGTDIDEAKVALAMSDEQLKQVIFFAGIAHLLGSIKSATSVRYAINAVVNGQATTPAIEWQRHCSTIETEHGKIEIPIGMTFDEFYEAALQNPDIRSDLHEGQNAAKSALHRLFNERYADIVKGFDELYNDDITPIEQERITWQQVEIPVERPKTRKAIDLMSALMEMMHSDD